MRKLPVLVETSTSQARHHRYQKGTEFKELAGSSVTCRKGCAHCCYHPLYISVLEGVSLYLHLRSKGLWSFTLRRRLEEHSKQTIGLAPAVWMLAEIPCPLLTEEQTCSAYEERPFLCRTSFSVGDPFLCRPAEFSEQTPMLYRHDRLAEYYSLEKKLLKEMNMPHARVPLSLAITLGEKLAEGKIEPGDVNTEVFKAHSEES